MSTGDRSRSVMRTYVIEAVQDPLTGEGMQDIARAERVVFQLLGSLWAVGGQLRIVADRVKIGELPRPKGGKDPIGETVGLIIEYQANTPLNLESLTAELADQIYLSNEPAPEPAAEPEPVAVVEPEDVESEGGGDGDEEEDDGIDGILDDQG